MISSISQDVTRSNASTDASLQDKMSRDATIKEIPLTQVDMEESNYSTDDDCTLRPVPSSDSTTGASTNPLDKTLNSVNINNLDYLFSQKLYHTISDNLRIEI